jgi:hypothetical protein
LRALSISKPSRPDTAGMRTIESTRKARPPLSDPDRTPITGIAVQTQP